jgi:hypothetical protein
MEAIHPVVVSLFLCAEVAACPLSFSVLIIYINYYADSNIHIQYEGGTGSSW